MDFTLTADKLQQCLPNNKEIDQWVPILTQYFEKYEINTVQRAAAFLAQCGHESMDFTVTHENLNYSAQALQSVFSKYFNNVDVANEYARQPEKIANRVYANRMGNGDEASGDGWKFCGKGILQITGHDNVMICSEFAFDDKRLVDDPSWLQTPEGCIVSACWFWITRKLNDLADQDNNKEITYKVNGGYIGLDDRNSRYENCKSVLAD